MNHPKTIDAISAAWLTEIRRAADVVRQPFVRAVDISPIRQGAGFLVQPGADPKERAALMRLLVDSLDAESEEGPTKPGGRRSSAASQS